MKLSKALLFVLIPLSLSGCGYSFNGYSFDGASIDYNLTKTLSVVNYINDSGGGPPNMGQTFTEGLKDYFQRRTKLELVQNKGDLQFDGVITNYPVRPQAISSSGNNNQADGTGLMRLTIGVQVNFTNTKKEEDNFQRVFSWYEDYDPEVETLNSVEGELVEAIFEQIYFDIFQASVAQW